MGFINKSRDIFSIKIVIITAVLGLGAGACERIRPSYSGVYKLTSIEKSDYFKDSNNLREIQEQFAERIALVQYPLRRHNGTTIHEALIISHDPEHKKNATLVANKKGQTYSKTKLTEILQNAGMLIDKSYGTLNNGGITKVLMRKDFDDSQVAHIQDYGSVCKWRLEVKLRINVYPVTTKLDKAYPTSNETTTTPDGMVVPLHKIWTEMPIKYDKWNSRSSTISISLSIRRFMNAPHPELCPRDFQVDIDGDGTVEDDEWVNKQTQFAFSEYIKASYKMDIPIDTGDLRAKSIELNTPEYDYSTEAKKYIGDVISAVNHRNILYDVLGLTQTKNGETSKMTDSELQMIIHYYTQKKLKAKFEAER